MAAEGTATSDAGCDDDRHALADALLDRLLDVPPDERGGLLEAWCAGDPALLFTSRVD